jgi:hypothetical protein
VESMITIICGLPAPSAAPLFRVAGVVGGTALSSYRPVAGQECFGFRTAASQVASVSGANVAGAAPVLNLRGYAGSIERAGLTGLTGLTHERRPEQVQQVQRVADGGRGVLLARADGSGSSTDGRNGTTSITSTKPMYPWDLRTSSPPG